MKYIGHVNTCFLGRCLFFTSYRKLSSGILGSAFEEFLEYYLWISIIIFILKSWLRFRVNSAPLRLFIIWHLNAWQDVSLLSLLWFEDCVHCVHCVFWRDLNNEILFSFRLDYDKFCRLRWRCHWHLLPASLLEKWFH